MTREDKFTIILNDWAKVGYKGIVQATTGFGKTFLAKAAIKGMIRRKGIKKCLVTVPTIVLKEQWEERLSSIVGIKIDILVDITAYTRLAEGVLGTYDLVINDELHTLATDLKKVLFDFDCYYLGLTATPYRNDKKEEMFLNSIPIIANVTFEECVRNKWVSPFMVFNVQVPLSSQDRINYEKANSTFKYWASQGGYGFNVGGATKWLADGTPEQKKIAAGYMRWMKKRKEIPVKNPLKLKALKIILECLPLESKGILFSQSIEFAIQVTSLTPNCASFHSKLGKKEKTGILEDFNADKLDWLSAVQALDAGFDSPKANVAIIISGYSAKLVDTQRTGRVIRYIEGKQAIIINLFTSDTQEEVWLTKRQEGVQTIKINYSEISRALPRYFESMHSNVSAPC